MLQLCDFDFLAWVERSMLFRDTFQATLTDKLGVAKEVADSLAFSGAIREHKGLIALFQDYCQEPGPEQDAFMAFVTYAQECYKQTQDVTSFVFATETGLVIGKVAATSGHGCNHGGSALMTDGHYNGNIARERYYRIDQFKEAMAEFERVALGRGDNKSVPSLHHDTFEIFIPEVIRCQPVKEAGPGDPFINRIEGIVSAAKEPLVAGLAVLGEALK